MRKPIRTYMGTGRTLWKDPGCLCYIPPNILNGQEQRSRRGRGWGWGGGGISEGGGEWEWEE